MSGYNTTFYIASIASNFGSSLAVQALYGQGTGDWTRKMVLSATYAAGRLVYNFMLGNVDYLKTNCGESKGLVGFVTEIVLTGLLFWGISYVIGYRISPWYAGLLALASAPLSDRLDVAIMGMVNK